MEMRAAGRSPLSIANALKRTKGAVNARVCILRQQQDQKQKVLLKQRKWTADEDDLLVRLKADGLLVATIAKRLDRIEAAVSDRLITLKRQGMIASPSGDWMKDEGRDQAL